MPLGVTCVYSEIDNSFNELGPFKTVYRSGRERRMTEYCQTINVSRSDMDKHTLMPIQMESPCGQGVLMKIKPYNDGI